jgi:hypothetical protein
MPLRQIPLPQMHFEHVISAMPQRKKEIDIP